MNPPVQISEMVGINSDDMDVISELGGFTGFVEYGDNVYATFSERPSTETIALAIAALKVVQ